MSQSARNGENHRRRHRLRHRSLPQPPAEGSNNHLNLSRSRWNHRDHGGPPSTPSRRRPNRKNQSPTSTNLAGLRSLEGGGRYRRPKTRERRRHEEDGLNVCAGLWLGGATLPFEYRIFERRPLHPKLPPRDFHLRPRRN